MHVNMFFSVCNVKHLDQHHRQKLVKTNLSLVARWMAKLPTATWLFPNRGHTLCEVTLYVRKPTINARSVHLISYGVSTPKRVSRTFLEPLCGTNPILLITTKELQPKGHPKFSLSDRLCIHSPNSLLICGPCPYTTIPSYSRWLVGIVRLNLNIAKYPLYYLCLYPYLTI